MPFYPSAQRDDGYDITDYYGVDPRLGTHGDLVELVRTARDRGLRVIADLVPNHTSVEHPWFQAAREGRENPYHDFYVWVDEKPEEKPGDVVFPDQENSNWAYDRQARGSGTCTGSTPTSRTSTWRIPEVRDEIAQVAGFWLEQGLSGFRLDAVPFLDRADGDAGGRDPGPARAAARHPRVHGEARRRVDPARRGEPPAARTPRRSSARAAARSSTCSSRSR